MVKKKQGEIIVRNQVQKCGRFIQILEMLTLFFSFFGDRTSHVVIDDLEPPVSTF